MNSGGRFAGADYEIINDVMNGAASPPQDRKCVSQRMAITSQITNIAALCGVEINRVQIDLYNILRCKLPSPSDFQDPQDPRTLRSSQMSDQRLVAEILLATEGNGNGSKHHKIIERYPHVFDTLPK